MKIVPDIASVRQIRSDVINVFAVYGGHTYAIVKATKYALGAARPIEVNGCSVRLLSEQVFQLDTTSTPGAIICLNNEYQILVSVDGSPAISVQDDQLEALQQKIKVRAEESQALRDERDKPRQEQEKTLRMLSIKGVKSEATLQEERLALAEQFRLNRQRQVEEEKLRQEEERLRHQEEKRREEQREKQQRARNFVTEIARRQERLHQDALIIERYPELRRYAEQLKLEQEIQATFSLIGLEYTLLLEIELEQAIKHEMQSLSAFREEAELLEDLAKEQELQEAQRLQQEQIIKQEVAAKQKQGAIDKQAAQYDRSTGPLAYEEAVTQLKAINRYIDAGASSRIIRVRATFLRTRCMNSRDAVPSISVQVPTSDGVGTKVGAIMGGIFGIIGGPLGMAIGAAAGGFIGNIADHAGDSAATSQVSPERKLWTTLIGDIDELVSELPE